MKEKRKANRKEYLTRGEKWAKADKQAKKELVELKRTAKKAGNYYVPTEAKVAFVVRIKGYDLYKKSKIVLTISIPSQGKC